MDLNRSVLKTKKGLLFTAIGVVILFLMVFYGTSAFNVTFKGKVIDADTKEPIVGAVVVASWMGEKETATGGTSRLEDVKETLTDKNGQWTIKGPRGAGEFLQRIYGYLTFLTFGYYTEPPQFIIFKPGYCSWPAGFDIEACKPKIKPDSIGNGEVAELPKLMDRSRETLSRNIPFITSEASEKTSIFHNLLDQDLGYRK